MRVGEGARIAVSGGEGEHDGLLWEAVRTARQSRRDRRALISTGASRRRISSITSGRRPGSARSVRMTSWWRARAIRPSTLVRAVDQDGALDDLECEIAVWCGGFAPRRLAVESGLAAGPRGGALVDQRMRSVSHPEVLAAGDAAEPPTLRNGAAVRMSCQAGIPMGAHAADVVAAALRGREEPEFDFGYLAWNVSLGRRDGLIQWVDRADRPKEHVTRGRRAARLKEFVTAGGAKSPAWVRRAPAWVLSLPAGERLDDGPPPAVPARQHT